MKKYSLTTHKSWGTTMRELEKIMGNWKGVENWDVSTPRGAFSESMNQEEHVRTVSITYFKDGKKVFLEMSKQKRAVDNLRVLFLALESIRMNDIRGIGEVLESAYKQLSASSTEEPFDPYQILGVREDASLEVVGAAYRARALQEHPDRGGSPKEMERINKAWNILKEKHSLIRK